MKHTLPQKRCHEGVALLMVILIAALAFVGVVAALSFIRPRNAIVKGESASDRALSVADGTVDQLLSAVNRLGFAFGAFSAQGDTANAATTAVVNKALADVNGGIVNGTRVIYVRTNGDMYTLGLPGGSYPGQLVSWPIASSGEVLRSAALSNIDTAYATDNQWFEVDAQVTYHLDPNVPDSWTIEATAYNISIPEIKRTVLAQARHGGITTTAILNAALANGQWYTYSVSSTSTPHFFCDYAGMYGESVSFGTLEVTEGPIFSSADLHMGGWAKDAVYSAGTVYDDAVDGGRHDGRFGHADVKGNAMTLSQAITAGLAKSRQAAPSWPKGDTALYGSSINKSASDRGMQDVCDPAYYINGGTSNTVVFSVEGTPAVGKVTINGVKKSLPSNGIIYVDGGNVTVSGKLLGQCTVGAGPTRYGNNGIIYVGGNITYNTPPRNDPNLPVPANPDALGLVAYDSIVIPSSTYNANHTLQIDAAIMAVHGVFRIAGDASTHLVSSVTSQQYTGWWNGAQALWSTDSAPYVPGTDSWRRATSQGYEAQHTRFDWNLLVSAPPMFPATAASGTPVTDHRFVPVPLGSPVLAQLQNLTQSGVVTLTPAQTDDHGQTMYYTTVIGGVTYYYGSEFGVSTVSGYTGTYNSAQLYRIAWREVIANPVPKP